MNNLKTETSIVKSFVLNPKKEYARNYYMKNKVKKVNYYNDYYRNNKTVVIAKLYKNKPKLPQRYDKEIKNIIISFN